MEFRALKNFSLFYKHADSIVLFNPAKNEIKKKDETISLFSFSVPVSGWGEGHTTETFCVNSPGEYEYHSTTIRGYGSMTTINGTPLQVTTYLVNNDLFQILFLAPLQEKAVTDELSKRITTADIVAVPVGANVLSFADATQFASNVSAKLLLPYGNVLDDKQIAKEVGERKAVSKHTVKRQDLATDTLQTIVLS